jgi:hypothetical protein
VQQKIVNLAAGYARSYISGLPDFVCTQTVTRAEQRNGRGWAQRDVLTVQLGYNAEGEHYKLTAINGRATKTDYRSMTGAVSEGEFGSIMGEILAPGSAKFIWSHEETLRERTVYVFSYTVPLEKSQYQIHYGTLRSNASTVTVAHHGYVYIDKETGAVLRLTQVGNMPAGFPVLSSATTLDYAYTDIGGKRYLLPLRAETEMSAVSIQTRNQVDFRDYRKFNAETSITFTEP